MSSDELALLRAIAAAPDDDTPRLVYADWLDEHDQPIRAEFIRLQCRIGSLETQNRSVVDQNVHLWKRQQDLLDDHLGELLGPLAAVGAAGDVEFRRGFVERVTIDVSAFLVHASALAAALPLTRVEVENVSARLQDFVRCPHLEVVTRIAAYSTEAVDNPLGFWGEVVYSAIHDTGLVSRLPHLESLDLEGCRIGDVGVEWFEWQDYLSLVELDLSGNDISDNGVANLVGYPVIRRLRRLILGGNPITDQGAFEIADRLGPNSRLEYLNMRYTPIGAEGQRALLARRWKVDLF
jgi:uncharacterized protein (TIGR02996 family)